MNLEQLIAFAAFAFVASVTPGPNNVILTATGSAVGVLRGLPALGGIVVGFALMIFVLAFGLGELIVERPEVLSALRYVGAAFLLWLSWQIACAPVRTQAESEAAPAPERTIGFLGAAAFQWVNPKAWLVAASAITSYMTAGGTAWIQALTFSAVFVAAGLVGCLPWLAFGATVRRYLRSPRAARIFNAFMGATLAASIVLIVR